MMFVLGLRHGLDPDHIACIDGLTWRWFNHGRFNACWVGTLFALGHGLLVTTMAVLISHLSIASLLPQAAAGILEWVPTVLLFAVGMMNLDGLLRQDSGYSPKGWKLAIIPRRLRDSDSPWSVVAIGVLFATVFDTATQTSAWGYVASMPGAGWQHALIAGLVFTAGMILTDTIDSYIVNRVGRGTNAHVYGARYRRVLGWLVVVMAFAVAIYNVTKAMAPRFELDDLSFTLVGALLITIVAVVGLHLRYSRQSRTADV